MGRSLCVYMYEQAKFLEITLHFIQIPDAIEGTTLGDLLTLQDRF
jgi:hypothetical protein